MNLFKKRHTNPPSFWKDYLALFAKKLNKKTPISELDFVVFDTETSGLDIRNDKLLTIGAVRVKANQINLAESLEIRVLQPDEVKTDAVPIHGILPNHELGVAHQDAIQQFIEYVGNSIVVGHNVQFDVKMINKGLQTMVKDQLKNNTLDTAKLAIRIEHLHPTVHLKPDAFTLDALCRRYNIRMHDRHNAAGDAMLTALLMLKLLAKLEKRGVRTWGELRR